MCGIAGKLYFDIERKVELSLIKAMCSSLIHRGPDDEGYFVDNNYGCGMRRLSIIDRKSGQQPIFNEDKSITIIFNGEIYNYKELKFDLQKKGHYFKTNSDTETILHCYEEYGLNFLSKLNGMFAIAIWDIKKKKLVLARDRIGIKPLYFYKDNKKLLFGSEIKAIIQDNSIERNVNFEALDLYLSFMYVPSPNCMFDNIHKLLPGHYLVYENSNIKVNQYWDVEFNPVDTKSESVLIEEFNHLFTDAVKLRMISEVPLGAFLSGGIDSSYIVAAMSKICNSPIKTFSIGFKEGGYHDETKYAKMIAEKYNTDHTVFNIDSSMLQLLPKYVYHFDEPFADYAAFPTYLISKLAKEFVTVVLTGDGGDEIFAGYERYYSEKLAEYYQMIPGSIRNVLLLNSFKLGEKLISPNLRLYGYFTDAIKKTELMDIEPMDRYIESFYKFKYKDKQKLFVDQRLIPFNFSLENFNHFLKPEKKYDNLTERLYLDIKTSLPEDMLTKVDRVTMAVSLEARVPFLDHRIVEFAAKIPSKMKLNLFNLKHFLKKAASKDLPKKIINRPKHGFSSPIDIWFRGELKEMLQDTLSENSIKDQGYFNYSYINQMITNHIEEKGNYGEKLFMIMVFQMWYDSFIKKRYKDSK